MKVGLAMLVRDEQENIERAVRQALPVVDHVTIVDTGSVDDTIAIATGVLVETGVPFQMHEREWRGFGPNRTELLELARPHSDYTLMLDADHTLSIDSDKPELTKDAYTITVRGTGKLSWRLPLITRSAHPFEYRGAAHSYLASDTPHTEAATDWLSIDGGSGATVEKLERDRGLLEAEFLAKPDNPRTVFYLARTYDDLDDWQRAITFYRIRAAMNGWEEETYYARMRLGVLLCEHISFAQGAPELLAAWQGRPTRIEALRWLANCANAVADKAAIPEGALFLRPDLYRQEAA